MIHNTFLLRLPGGEVLASSRYWPIEVPEESIREFLATRSEIQSASSDSIAELPLMIGDMRMQAQPCGKDDELLLVFTTDPGEDERLVSEKLREGAKAISAAVEEHGLEYAVENYESLIEPAVTTRLKIALVGEGGTGKTTTLHLLLGDTPPLQYVPTIALNLETVENIRFGSYSLVIWDFAGQERFRRLWKFYFHGADVIFLVCDSTLRNVIVSKDILKLIKRDAPKVPVFAIANKQDKPGAMKPDVIQKILGVPTYPMVAIDKSRREEMLRILMNAAAQYVGVALPDLPVSEILRFVDTDAGHLGAPSVSVPVSSQAPTGTGGAQTTGTTVTAAVAEDTKESAEAVAGAPGDEGLVEVVEEVLVDEDGRVVEGDEEYEVIEEIVEVIEESVETVDGAGPKTTAGAGPVSQGAGGLSIEPAPQTPGAPESGVTAESDQASTVPAGPTALVREIVVDVPDADEMVEAEPEQVLNNDIDAALEVLHHDEVAADGDDSSTEADEHAVEEILDSLDTPHRPTGPARDEESQSRFDLLLDDIDEMLSRIHDAQWGPDAEGGGAGAGDEETDDAGSEGHEESPDSED